MSVSSDSNEAKMMQTPAVKSLVHRHRQLAPSAAIKVSPLCLGSMNFGDAWKPFMGECNKKTSFEILDFFYEKGGNFIDTANGYQSEESETWIGEWMAARKNRDELVIATKYSMGFKRHESEKLQSTFVGNNKKSLRLSLDASLKKLQTDYIDLFYVHWWDYTTSIPELMQSLNDVVTSGKVLYLGISDTPAWVVAKANQYARDHGLQQFSVYQGIWNAGVRDFEREIIPLAREDGMAICPYGALGQGKFQTEAAYAEREKNSSGRKSFPVTQKEKNISKALEKIANKKNTKVTSVAMAYVMQKTPYVFPIIGGRKLEHLKDNIEALSVQLSDEDIEAIEKANDFDAGFPHTFLSGSTFVGAEPVGAYKASDISFTKMAAVFDWVDENKAIKPAALD